MNPRKRHLSQQDLRAMGATPGLMARRYDATGRARLEQLAPKGADRRRVFVRRLRLADDREAIEGEPA